MKIPTALPDDGPTPDAFGWLFFAYTVAQTDLLKAEGPTAVRPTTEANVFEVEIAGPFSRAILTVAVTMLPDDLLFEPVTFRVVDIWRFDTVFSYSHDQPVAYVMRMMTSWLEDIFLIHRDAIVAALRAALAALTGATD